MIPVIAESVKYPGDDELYEFTGNKIVFINPMQVCSIKPAVYRDASDICTADGMVYRTKDHEAVQEIATFGSPLNVAEFFLFEDKNQEL